jgi:hypothetical protein
MLDNSLLNEINSAIVQVGRCQFVADERSAEFIDGLCRNFHFDIKQLFIWQNANVKSYTEYGADKEKWGAGLSDFLDKFDPEIFLVITNEQFYPWKILQCGRRILVRLLSELPHFEYFLFDFSLSRVVFDTHDNFFAEFCIDPGL